MDFKEIETVKDITFYKDINLEKYTTIRLASKGSVALVHSLEALKNVIKLCKTSNIKFHIVGWGANQVLMNCGETLFIKLDFSVDREIFKSPKNTYRLNASTPLNLLTSHAMKYGLKGWDVFTGIPASLGGAIFMNAGTALGEIGSVVETVDVLDVQGQIYTHVCSEDSFYYRGNNFIKEGEIIVSAKLKHFGINESVKSEIKDYLEYRKSSQPLASKNCGSVFKNYSASHRAGITIDSIGLKNFGVNNLIVSPKHANFIENTGAASAEDFKSLTDLLKKELERYSGIKFELEVKIY